MELTNTQKQAVTQWVKDGCGLSEIQKKLSTEFSISMTYMDLRFLIIDMGIELQDKTSKPFLKKVSDISSEDKKPEKEDTDPNDHIPSNNVSIEVDRVVRPGSIVSGSVTFSDGISALWMLDQFGRITMEAGKDEYTPSQQDLQTFQEKLKQALQKRGA